MKWDMDTDIRLNNGVAMPMMGLGVYEMDGRQCLDAVRFALKSDYRHIDTARLYGNEREVGEAVRASRLPREKIFVVTKLWNADHGYDRALRAFDESARLMGLDVIDQYLIHWPVERLRADSWRALERLYRDGRVRSIGVSNYTVRHLQELLDTCEVPPAVNQVEFHPWLYQKDLLEFCCAHDIVVVAYSPLTKGRRISDPELAKIAAKYRRSPAQILIRWVLQHGVVVIPKSSRPERILENAMVDDFEISADDMKTLNAFDRGQHVTWDPTDAP